MDMDLRCDQDSEVAHTDHATHLTRARVPMMPDPLLDPELAALRRLVSRTRSSANKMVWRAAVQRRTARIAGILRSLPKLIVAPGVDRMKGPKAWLITATSIDGVSQVVLELLTGTTGHTVADLGVPIPVRVRHRDLVDVTRLDQLLRNGSLTIEFAEALP